MSVAVHLRARAGLLAVSAGAILWGTTGVAVRIIHERTGLGALAIGCLRLAVAAVVLGLIGGPRGVRLLRVALARHRGLLILAGAGLGAYQALYFVGVQYVGVSISTLVSLAVAPIALTIFAAVGRRRMPSVVSLVTLVCAITGLVLVSFGADGHSGPHPLFGVLASLGSGLGYAASTVLNRRLARDGDPLVLTAATSAVGAVLLVPVALPFGLWWPRDAVAGGWLVYIGIASTVVAYGLFYAGLRTTSSEVAGVLTLLEPLTATVLAAVVVHEAPTGRGLIGCGLLLAAIAALYVRTPEPSAVSL
jgi:drug/metabolite transporter, DME family